MTPGPLPHAAALLLDARAMLLSVVGRCVGSPDVRAYIRGATQVSLGLLTVFGVTVTNRGCAPFRHHPAPAWPRDWRLQRRLGREARCKRIGRRCDGRRERLYSRTAVFLRLSGYEPHHWSADLRRRRPGLRPVHGVRRERHPARRGNGRRRGCGCFGNREWNPRGWWLRLRSTRRRFAMRSRTIVLR